MGYAGGGGTDPDRSVFGKSAAYAPLILGCTILAAEAGEMIGTVQAFMIAGMPATKLRDAVLSHPTMVEGFNALFATL